MATVWPMGLHRGSVDRKSQQSLGAALVASYWLVRRVRHKDMANMRKATLECTIAIEAGKEAGLHRVTLPILQNVKPVKKGEELLLYREPTVPLSIVPAQTLAQSNKKGSAKEAAAPATPRQPQSKNKTM